MDGSDSEDSDYEEESDFDSEESEEEDPQYSEYAALVKQSHGAQGSKKKERLFWERMTSVLDDKKLSTWKALDKALTKYYALLVDRQNLIEETGLLNQQNEELKTLLNQYL